MLAFSREDGIIFKRTKIMKKVKSEIGRKQKGEMNV